MWCEGAKSGDTSSWTMLTQTQPLIWLPLISWLFQATSCWVVNRLQGDVSDASELGGSMNAAQCNLALFAAGVQGFSGPRAILGTQSGLLGSGCSSASWISLWCGRASSSERNRSPPWSCGGLPTSSSRFQRPSSLPPPLDSTARRPRPLTPLCCMF